MKERKSPDIVKEIGRRIAECRADKALSLEDLSRITNIEKTTLYRYEKGQTRMLNTLILKRLADVLEVSEEFLIFGTDSGDNNRNCFRSSELTGILYTRSLKNIKQTPSKNHVKRYICKIKYRKDM